MRLRDEVERAIYAAAFVRSYESRVDRGITPGDREAATDNNCDPHDVMAAVAVNDAEGAVASHRCGVKLARRWERG